MNQYIKVCARIYGISAIGISIVLIIWYFNIIPIYITFPLLMYELAGLAFTIGRASQEKRPEQTIKLNEVL